MKNFRAWIFRIATNLVNDHFAPTRTRMASGEFDATDERQGDPAEKLIEQERFEAVSGCLERLGVDFRHVLVAAINGEPTGELSRRLGITPDLVYQRKSRALKSLQECVERRLA